jgi:hypothetical protein
MTTTDQLFSLLARQGEVVKRVKNGGLTIVEALAGTQAILDKKTTEVSSPPPGFYPRPTTWCTSPEEQIQKVLELLEQHPDWGFTAEDVPLYVPAGSFATRTEVDLLAIYLPKKGKIGGVQRTFDELYGCIQAPTGFTKYSWPEFKSDAEHLRLLDGRKHRPGIRWVAFDPFANWIWGLPNGHKVEDLWATGANAGNNFAASEVLNALLLCPDLLDRMDGQNFPYFDLAGYQYNWGLAEKAWSCSPSFGRWDGGLRVELNINRIRDTRVCYSAPTVREL